MSLKYEPSSEPLHIYVKPLPLSHQVVYDRKTRLRACVARRGPHAALLSLELSDTKVYEFL